MHVEPKRVVERIPKGMAIPHLRERLVRIMHDFRTQASLREGCNTILSRDCILLAQACPSSLCVSLSITHLHLACESCHHRLVCCWLWQARWFRHPGLVGLPMYHQKACAG